MSKKRTLAQMTKGPPEREQEEASEQNQFKSQKKGINVSLLKMRP